MIIELNNWKKKKLNSVDKKLDIQNNSVNRHVDFVYSALGRCNDIKNGGLAQNVKGKKLI